MELLFYLEKNGWLREANMKQEGKRYYCPLFTQSEKKLQDVNTSLLCYTSLKKSLMTILFLQILKWQLPMVE